MIQHSLSLCCTSSVPFASLPSVAVVFYTTVVVDLGVVVVLSVMLLQSVTVVVAKVHMKRSDQQTL